MVYSASSYFASELLFFQLNFRIPSVLRNGIQVDSFPSPFRHVTSRQDPACGRPANNSLLRRGQLPNTPKSRKQHVHCHKHHILRRRRRQDSRGAFISPRPHLGRGDRWRRHCGAALVHQRLLLCRGPLKQDQQHWCLRAFFHQTQHVCCVP